MGFLDRLTGNDKTNQSRNRGQEQTRKNNNREYQQVNRLDESDTSPEQNRDVDLLIQTVTINQNTDIIQTKDELRAGNIVIADISHLGSGLSEERVLTDLEQAVEDVNGDIAMQNTDEHVILTPNGVGISRKML